MAAKRSLFGEQNTPAVKRWENFNYFYNTDFGHSVFLSVWSLLRFELKKDFRIYFPFKRLKIMRYNDI